MGIRCAHCDTVLYPLAEVAMEVDRVETRVRAALDKGEGSIITEATSIGPIGHKYT